MVVSSVHQNKACVVEAGHGTGVSLRVAGITTLNPTWMIS